MDRTWIYSAMSAALLFVGCSEEQPYMQTEEVGPYTVSLVEKNVWHVEDCNSSNPHGLCRRDDGSISFNGSSDMYIIRGEKKAILIDLSNKIAWADSAEYALRSIFNACAGKRDKIITVTHNHGDHTGMYYAFKNESGITFMLPENDFKADTVFTPDRMLLKDRDCIDLGGMEIECFQCEGHTPGSMIFFLKGHNLAFSGDALGSGTGVWLFNKQCFDNFRHGVDRLRAYLEDPASGIDTSSFRFLTGHTYQKGEFEIDYRYVRDMQVLNEQICSGTAQWEPYNVGFPGLDATFKYGNASIDWNKAQSEEYAAECVASE